MAQTDDPVLHHEDDALAHGLERWARMVIAHRRAMLVGPLLLVLLCLPLSMRVRDNLSPGGWLPPSAESVQVDHELDATFGRRATAHYLVFSDPAGRLNVADTAFQREIGRSLAPLRSDPAVSAIYAPVGSAPSTFSDRLVSSDGNQAIAVVMVEQDINDAADDLPRLMKLLPDDSQLAVTVGGWPATTAEFQDLTTHDLARAEMISLPITLIVLVLIFGGILLAGLPLVTTALALIPTLAVIAVVSRIVETSIFSLNIVIMVGLAVGVDYALIVVSRFREERGRRSNEDALATTMITAGRTVLVSGAAVATGLAGLLAFGVPAATATAIAAGCVVLLSVALSLTLLPAVLLLLGDRIAPRPSKSWPGTNPLLPLLKRGASGLRRLLDRHPGWALLCSTLLLLAMAAPVLTASLAMPSLEILPPSQPARQTLEEVQDAFPTASLSPITLIVEPRRNGAMTSNRNLDRLQDFIAEIETIDGVESVTSVWSFLPTGTGSGLIANGIRLDPDLSALAQPYLTDGAAVVEVQLAGSATSDMSKRVVNTLRADFLQLSNGDFAVRAGGETATALDMMDHLRQRAPWTLGIVLGLTAIVLFLQFRSVVLPIKAIVLNMLSLTASFGVVVWVFGQGHLAGPLGFEPLGYIVVVVPVLMFCFMFGLSMDYEVIMLSRIREAWLESGDNREAVSTGLRTTTRIVTSAALIMAIVFAAFGTSDIQVIQQIGLGLALAVILDATIIRLVALPAAMQIMGRWNWWSPTVPWPGSAGKPSVEVRSESHG